MKYSSTLILILALLGVLHSQAEEAVPAQFNFDRYSNLRRPAVQAEGHAVLHDRTGGLGPYFVTPDEVPPGAKNLSIKSILNGKVMQSANTSDMLFPVDETIELLSECLTLEPGDVIAMGTPSGVGYARKPPVWMKAGDVVEIEIEGVGTLRNPIIAES